jgi:hypothetical protein
MVDNGQIEFVGGGWVQNDEANPDYPAIINQVRFASSSVLAVWLPWLCF